MKASSKNFQVQLDCSLFTSDLNVNSSSIQSDDPSFCSEEVEDDMKENERDFWMGKPEEENSDFVAEEDLVEKQNPKDLLLQMPSFIGMNLLKNSDLDDLVEEEVQLCLGQANDSLEKLRTNLGHKVVLYRMNFQSSSSVWTDTRSQSEI